MVECALVRSVEVRLRSSRAVRDAAKADSLSLAKKCTKEQMITIGSYKQTIVFYRC